MNETFTRAEVVAALAGQYRDVSSLRHVLTEKAVAANERGEAAMGLIYSDEAEQLSSTLEYLEKAAAALGISTSELAAEAE